MELLILVLVLLTAILIALPFWIRYEEPYNFYYFFANLCIRCSKEEVEINTRRGAGKYYLENRHNDLEPLLTFLGFETICFLPRKGKLRQIRSPREANYWCMYFVSVGEEPDLLDEPNGFCTKVWAK